MHSFWDHIDDQTPNTYSGTTENCVIILYHMNMFIKIYIHLYKYNK